jgi:hypothetical protein
MTKPNDNVLLVLLPVRVISETIALANSLLKMALKIRICRAPEKSLDKAKGIWYCLPGRKPISYINRQGPNSVRGRCELMGCGQNAEAMRNSGKSLRRPFPELIFKIQRRGV